MQRISNQIRLDHSCFQVDEEEDEQLRKKNCYFELDLIESKKERERERERGKGRNLLFGYESPEKNDGPSL